MIQYRLVCVAIVANSKSMNRVSVFPNIDPEVQSITKSWSSSSFVINAVQTQRARFGIMREMKLERARCLTENFSWSRIYPVKKPLAIEFHGVTRAQRERERILKYCVRRVPVTISERRLGGR